MMHISKIGFENISALSFKDIFYQNQSIELESFYAYEPSFEGLKKAIEDRNSFPVDRTLLHSVLSDHYKRNKTTSLQNNHIDLLLQEKTFTVITAHQPCILGGPAFYFYKICSIINLCKSLKSLHPEHNFIPVFISGAEDHDFEEIKSIQLYGKTLEWKTDNKGPIGRFSTEGLSEVIEAAGQIMGSSENAAHLTTIFNNALSTAETYNDFVFNWINAIFGEYGLLVFNMDDHRLKRSFIPIMAREISERSSEKLIVDTQQNLLEFNFKPQAFPRDVNLFYMMEQSRERIYFEAGRFKIVNTNLSFSIESILEELHSHPERFSPNVIMRPIFQEFILPNIAYVGGGGEVSYWLERKQQFEYFGIFYPCIIRRNSVMLISKSIQKVMDKLNIKEENLCKDEDILITSYLENVSEMEFHLKDELTLLNEIYQKIAEKAKAVDATLEPFVLSEATKILKLTESIESRIKRSLKHKEETSINQIRAVKTKLFPNHSLQERTESLLQYLVTEKDLLAELIPALNPIEKEFLFIYL